MVSIRNFDSSNGSADVFELMRIDAECAGDEHHVFYGPHWWKRFVRQPQCLAFVAESGGEVAGFVAVQLTKEGAYLAWLFVQRAHRRRGVGRALLAHVLALVLAHCPRGLATLHVETTNEAAMALYETAGFRLAQTPSGRTVVVQDHPCHGCQSHVMELRLPSSRDPPAATAEAPTGA